MFVVTLIAIPIVLVRVPSDYFARSKRPHSLALKVVRTVLGVLLILVGIAMLVLPGQGLLTIVVGLSILELPIKDRLIARILSNPKVRGAVDHLRSRAGKPPLQALRAC
jgi:hypothetical protein